MLGSRIAWRSRLVGACLPIVIFAACTSSPLGRQAVVPPAAARVVRALPIFVNGSSIRVENRHKGDGLWHLRYPHSDGIQGYASRTSVPAGQPISFFVSTTAKRYSVDVFRMGWYGGAGARLMTHLGPLDGKHQTPCYLGARRMVVCPWSPSFTLDTHTDWVSGAYLARLNASNKSDSFVPFVVRERTPRAPILLQLSVTTWQAYNHFGGYDLYRGADWNPAHRSYAVTFDRPYAWPGAGLFFVEYPMIYWLESHGYDVAYSTDIDLAESQDDLSQRRIFISTGHDEYYSTVMRNALESAVGHGVSLIFAGANDLYRHIRFESSSLGADRIEVNYKDASLDPFMKTDPMEVTNQWRDAPVNRPEQGLVGAQYEMGEFKMAPWRPTLRPAWLFYGTGFTRDSTIPNLFGWEHDLVESAFPIPQGLVRVAHVDEPRGGSADSTFYIAASGAGVFDAGGIWFDCALGPGCEDRDLIPIDKRVDTDPHIAVDPRLQRMMANLMAAMWAHEFRL
ncbi:MAG TPA: N,N-dimethylformamidase beta subunit family domain-containing protein [Actinomycetota bacterium]|nr:N,N-dimethylformamidase beta subunit family domain-containing protein [Actinomycetota bacterium]